MTDIVGKTLENDVCRHSDQPSFVLIMGGVATQKGVEPIFARLFGSTPFFDPEKNDEEYRGHRCEPGERQPDTLPVEGASSNKVFVDHDSAGEAAEECTKAVAHHKEKTLSARTHAGLDFRLDEQ